MAGISVEELKKLPYLDVSALDDRTVNLMPLWDGTAWHMWFDTPIGLIAGKIVDTTEVDYVAKSAARSTDLFIPFVHIAWQQCSWREICPLIIAINQDFHNMGTSIAQLKHFQEFRKLIGDRGAHTFALTELEYLVTLCRTTFDLLQEMIAWIWKNKVRLLDERSEAFRLAHPLPKTFSRMVLQEKQEVRNTGEIETQFGLPTPLAEQYARVAHFFSDLRKIRDSVVHGGRGFGMMTGAVSIRFCSNTTVLRYRTRSMRTLSFTPLSSSAARSSSRRPTASTVLKSSGSSWSMAASRRPACCTHWPNSRSSRAPRCASCALSSPAIKNALCSMSRSSATGCGWSKRPTV